MKAGRPPEGGQPATGPSVPDAPDAVEMTFEEAMARWQEHLRNCRPSRPRLAPLAWGRHSFEEAS
jgi:hypothetical protein